MKIKTITGAKIRRLPADSKKIAKFLSYLLRQPQQSATEQGNEPFMCRDYISSVYIIRCKAGYRRKKGKKERFFEKKLLKSLSVQKKSITFALAFREMLLQKGGILVQDERRKACFYAESQPRMPIGFRRKTSGNSSVGRAQPCQGWGRGSESRFPLNMLNKKESLGIGLNEIMPRWRNWQTRTFQVRVPRGVQVRVLFWALFFIHHDMMERWRNWQTRYFEGVVSIATWEFESPPLHIFVSTLCGNSSVGRAQPCQGWGRGSESRFPLFQENNIFR